MRENDIIPRICITIRKGGFENLVLLFLKYSMIFLKSFSPNLPVEIMKWNSQFFFIFFLCLKLMKIMCYILSIRCTNRKYILYDINWRWLFDI
jgi:hypothetical protein